MDVLTDPMLASQFGRLERRIKELEAENQRLREALIEIREDRDIFETNRLRRIARDALNRR